MTILDMTVKVCAVAVSTAIFLAACSPSEPAPVSSSDSVPSHGSRSVPHIEAIASGANLAGANGVMIGPDGMLYIASVLGSNITVINPESGEIIKAYGAEDGVVGPDDLAFAADGSLYWTSILTGEVGGFNASGEKIVAAQLGPGVNPITFSDDGRLFVSQCFFGTNLYEIDPLGVTEPRLISDQLGPGCGLNGMDWGPDGRLYGPRWFHQQVVSFDIDDNSMRVEVEGLTTPASVKFDSQGRLHVLDTGTGEVLRVENGVTQAIAQFTPGLDNFAFDGQDRIFVSSFTDGFIKRVNLDGSITELQPGGMAHSGGVAFHQGNIVTADLHGIRGYASNGDEAFVERNVLGVGKMGGAVNLSSDGDLLILASWVDGDVRIWDQQAKLRVWEKSGLLGPVAAVRYGDRVVVTEHGNQRVVGFSDTDANDEITLASGLPAPTGLAVASGDLYVTDRVLGQVLRLAQDGLFLDSPEVVVSGLTTPEGFVVRDNSFVVVEADLGEITEISSDGSRRSLGNITPGSQAASPVQPPSQIFNGIAEDDQGNLYVTAESERQLYKITFNQ